jgi:hypothetical protein
MNEIAVTWEAIQQSSKLNKVAAAWIAVAVVFSVLSSII